MAGSSSGGPKEAQSANQDAGPGGGSGHLTPTQLASHLACAHLTQLDRLRREGALCVEFNPDPRLDALRERGLQHEAAYIELLRREGRSICDLRNERDPAATRRAMVAGHDAIVQATLRNDVFNGVADVLLRRAGASSLGGYVYEPADTKLSVETKPGTILQLCTYAELLEPLQGVQPECVHVVTPEGQQTYRTALFSAYYRLARGQLLRAATQEPAPLTYPHPVAHCDICVYWRHCDKQRRADDHPSLIASIRGSQVREFQQQGLPTVAVIAERAGELPDRPTRGAPETFQRLGHQAQLQLASRDAEVPRFEALQLETGRGLARLPEPSAGDMFLDFEGDPFVAPHGLEYLTGVVTRDDAGQPQFSQRWALNTQDERAALESFIDFSLEQVRRHPNAHIYHFGAYEPAALKRVAARHATRGAELDQLLRGRRFVDLHATVREAFRVGVERYGLKELESLHDFKRRLGLRDAALARRELEVALELGNVQSISEAIRESVAAYNGDDCLSAESLRRWLEHQRGLLVAQGQPIARPVAGELAPSEEVGARDLRIQGLRKALLTDVPSDPKVRTADERAKVLLAAMLGYYRQEEKNAWWEFFRLRDLPRDEHLDEREAVGGLLFIEQLPKEGRQRNARCRFSFPFQETAISTGDGVVWPVWFAPEQEPETLKSKVEDFDLDARTLVLSLSEKALRNLPGSAFRDPVVSAKPLEDSLLGFAEHVRDKGFEHESAYAAAGELLRAAAPRRAGYPQEALQRSGEDAGQALVRLCAELDGGVLPVQGPPGAGKTTQGAKAILALAAAGKRVGITAVSHKVIDNLLSAVRKADDALARPRGVRLVHRDEHRESEDGIEFIQSTPDTLASISPGTVVGGAAWLWAHPDAMASLDVLFVDEAGQMALAQVLAAARAARSLVLLGDPQQLEQPARGAHEEGADIAALVHLVGEGQATLRPEQGLFLDRTYRLHPAICAFTSEVYYEGRLQAGPGLDRQRLEGPTPFAGAGPCLVEVLHEGNQAQSLEEVDAVMAVARSLLESGTTWTNADHETRPLRPDDILVVAPYNAQVSALKRALGAVGVSRVGTVDKFQGQEAPVVIYSCTSSSSGDAPRGMTFLYDPHRFNVASSRARCTVIVVASPKLLEPDCRTAAQMQWANGICRFAEMARRVPYPGGGLAGRD